MMNRNYSIGYWIILGILQFLFFYALSFSENLIPKFLVYFDALKSIWQEYFSWVFFSIGDMFYIFLIVFMLWNMIRKKWKTILISLNLLILVYYLNWGMLYFQTPIESQLPEVEFSTQNLKILANYYVETCKTERELISEDEYHTNDVNTNFLHNALTRGFIENNQVHLHKLKNNDPWIKTSLFSNFLSKTGILGYYNPFTTESQYNKNLPIFFKHFTIAHEYAHQQGYAREEEANFVGYIVAINSRNKILKYSANWFALKSILAHLKLVDRKYVDEIKNNFSEKMKKDVWLENTFIVNNKSIFQDVFSYTNDIFIRSNRQDGSITYSYFVRLLMKYKIKGLLK